MYHDAHITTIESYLKVNNDKLLVLATSPPIFANPDGFTSLLALTLENPLSFFKRNINSGLRLSCEGSNSGERDISVYAHKVILDVVDVHHGSTRQNKIEVRIINTVEFCNQIGRGNPVWVGVVLSLQHYYKNNADMELILDQQTVQTVPQACIDDSSKQFNGVSSSLIWFVSESDLKELLTLTPKLSEAIKNQPLTTTSFRVDDHKYYSCALGMASGLVKKFQARKRSSKKTGFSYFITLSAFFWKKIVLCICVPSVSQFSLTFPLLLLFVLCVSR